MKLVISGTARAEVARIADYIARDSSRAAPRMTAQLRRRFGEIQERPHAGRLVEGFEQRQIRRKLHGNYLIFYRITAERIEIHSAMDYASILRDAP